MVNETRLERQCVKFATKPSIGVSTVKLYVNDSSGFPDRMFLIPKGRPLFVLFKKPNISDELTGKQNNQIEFLKMLGYNAVKCDSIKEFLEHLHSSLSQAVNQADSQ